MIDLQLSPYVNISISGIELTIPSSYPLVNDIIRSVLWVDSPKADQHLALILIFLICLSFKQLHAFSRPPPVQRKRLPRRPALQILFKPDDISSSNDMHGHQPAHGMGMPDGEQEEDTVGREEDDEGLGVSPRIPSVVGSDSRPGDEYSAASTSSRKKTPSISSKSVPGTSHDYEKKTKEPTIRPHDLPDSFAPLLSSSQMELIYESLSTSLLHATVLNAQLRLRSSRHEIPLDKDSSRPQLILDIPKTGCKVNAVAAVGSDGFSTEEDLDPGIETTKRSYPMVKHAGVTLDPPLPLVNVAPTLIHFPTLFEDNVVKYTLRRVQIVRFALDALKSISSFIEKILWILESKCQIHLGKVSINPMYKGAEHVGDNISDMGEPQWRLSLAFSGHVVLFGWIPIPFVNISLPTWIIPQPHALLEYLVSSQPLASAKMKREAIAEERIALALIDTVETWGVEVEAVATPPALGVDLALPGGITIAVEAMHGTDVSGGRPRGGVEGNGNMRRGMVESLSNSDTLSSCTFSENDARNRIRTGRRSHRSKSKGSIQKNANLTKIFDANDLVPWKFHTVLKGKINADKLSVQCTKICATHDPSAAGTEEVGSKISASGNFVVCIPDIATYEKAEQNAHQPRKRASTNQLHHLALEAERRSVAAILLFPEKKSPSLKYMNQRPASMLKYDYNFDIDDDTSLDAVSLSIGATHPMLKGGTIITTILETIYSYGTLSAREESLVDMSELRRKRNILRHLPVVDFTAGIQNIFIPEESMSFSDDAQTNCIPELLGGQMMMRVVGGFSENGSSLHSPSSRDNKGGRNSTVDDSAMTNLFVKDGVKVVVDFGGSVALNNSTNVNEFPELNIFDDQKLLSTFIGSIDGTIGFHLRPQKIDTEASEPLTKNLFNPLEAYEIDFSDSNVAIKISEANATLGHRRLIIPSETAFGIFIVNSVVDMAFDGNTECELNWDFQGSSPILQSTEVGLNPQLASHEEKRQVNLLINSLRQGRFNLNVSSVGGLTITQAATSREDKEGLYDWKFFNAIVSPNDESAGHILKVVHDKRTMGKVIQIIKLVNHDLEKLASYILKQVWRAKDIFDEHVHEKDPGNLIPSRQMARLLSLLLCGDASQVDDVLPIVSRVVEGNGLNVMKTKELLRKNLSIYEDYAPEIDRGVRWAEVMLGSIEAPKPFVEKLSPMSIDLRYKDLFVGFPDAKQLYSVLSEKRHLPLEPSFSAMVSMLAPYMSFPQVEYILQCRSSSAWQSKDLRRLRYVYSVKKKVLEISESYGGLSFMPQSFFVSVFVGEATRASLRASDRRRLNDVPALQPSASWQTHKISNESTLHSLRKRRQALSSNEDLQKMFSVSESSTFRNLDMLSPAGKIAALSESVTKPINPRSAMRSSLSVRSSRSKGSHMSTKDAFDVGDSLLGPEDVAILLQAGLTSSMRGSTVVQLNQRMLLDLMASQPRIFAVAVLCEIGSPGGQGNPRGLTSALMALLDLDQSSFTEFHRLDIHQLLESWLPGLKIPRREDHLAGGRWASRSYYDAIYNVAESILEESKPYTAFKGHVQRVRHNNESDLVPTAKELTLSLSSENPPTSSDDFLSLSESIERAKQLIGKADEEGQKALNSMQMTGKSSNECENCQTSIQLYNTAFEECRRVLKLDKLAFHADWFKSFYCRNYDALMVKSVYENIIDDVDQVRKWMACMYKATSEAPSSPSEEDREIDENSSSEEDKWERCIDFMHPENYSEQCLLDSIITLLFHNEAERGKIRNDPLVRLLISNPNGNYKFTIVSAMGVITEGKKGLELEDALQRLKAKRNVQTIRADTGTARSLEYNALKIHDAIDEAVQLRKNYGLLGYSQGSPNILLAESLLLSGSPTQQEKLNAHGSRLVCRQLLFSAANGSMHGPATEAKIHRLIVMCESFFKYQQGYCSRAFISAVLDMLTNLMDSAPFQKFVAGGGGTFLHNGSRAFWREAQHLTRVPTCVLRGVLEKHTTPESLQMISNLLSKAAGSDQHDSQVHVYEAVGRPIYTKNRNAQILENCEMGGAVQRTHHWSPLDEEVKFVATNRDEEYGTFLCAKDRHVFPWVDVNARFGFIDYENEDNEE